MERQCAAKMRQVIQNTALQIFFLSLLLIISLRTVYGNSTSYSIAFLENGIADSVAASSASYSVESANNNAEPAGNMSSASLYGEFGKKQLIQESNKIIALASGWNLISFPLGLKNESITNAVSGISPSLSIVYRYDGGVTWKSYDGAGGSPDTLSSIAPGKGYWVKMTNSEDLENIGYVLDYVSIPLSSGWNLIGYPKSASRSLTEVFSNITDNLAIVYRYDGGVIWKSYDGPGGSPDTLTTLSPGKGYYVKMNNADTLSVIN
ncbi:MAG: hypothetical protein V1859_10905 [archaeon]